MLEQKTLLTDLLVKIREYVDEQGYAKGTKYLYIAGINRLRRHFEHKGQAAYSRDTAWDCVLERREKYEIGNIAYDTFLYTWKVAEMLEHYSKTGTVVRRQSQVWGFTRLSRVNETLLIDYESQKLADGFSSATITGERSAIRLFLLYLESKRVHDISAIKQSDISAYILVLSQQNPAGISNVLSRLRAFFKYLIGKGLIDENLVYSLQLQTAIRKKILFGFSVAEADAILGAVGHDSRIGKRDYAMLTLARYTGLRAVDVIHMKLQDIDWMSGEIRIVQHKTKRPLILPLENHVGNAIAEYILNARPDSTVPEIFLRTKAPFVSLGYGNGSAIIRRYAKRAGVMWNPDEHKGFHSFRRSIGINMLSADVPLSTISEVLGHSRTDSTKPYLAADLKNLKMCAIPLTGLECAKGELQ